MIKHLVRRGSVVVVVACLALAGLAVAPARALNFTFNVDTTLDGVDVDGANPACLTEEGKCSLRAAVMQANALEPVGDGHHLIIVPAGTYSLVLVGVGENGAATGDLDIREDMIIRGAGASKTIIRMAPNSSDSGNDRIFHVGDPGGIDFVVEGATLRQGNSHAGGGAAILVEDDTDQVTLDGVVVRNNLAKGSIIESVGALVIRDSSIISNVSESPTIDVTYGNMTIRRSTISGNTARFGTVRYALAGTALIDRTTISGNEISTCCDGVAVQLGVTNNDTTPMTIRNSTIAGNKGPGNAAIGVRAGNALTIESTTIAGNSLIGIWASASTTVRNTILANNSGGNCDSPLPSSLGHNLDSGTSCNFAGPGDIVSGAAALALLDYNGGPTRTRALGPDSDAIDHGFECPSIDQRGFSRPKDGDGNGSAKCDMGAFEAPTFVAPSAPPSLEPTASPATVAPTEEPTLEPGESAATPTDGGSPGPGESSGAPAATVVTSAQPEPSATAGDGGSILWIVIALLAILMAFALGMGLRRQFESRASPRG